MATIYHKEWEIKSKLFSIKQQYQNTSKKVILLQIPVLCLIFAGIVIFINNQEVLYYQGIGFVTAVLFVGIFSFVLKMILILIYGVITEKLYKNKKQLFKELLTWFLLLLFLTFALSFLAIAITIAMSYLTDTEYVRNGTNITYLRAFSLSSLPDLISSSIKILSQNLIIVLCVLVGGEFAYSMIVKKEYKSGYVPALDTVVNVFAAFFSDLLFGQVLYMAFSFEPGKALIIGFMISKLLILILINLPQLLLPSTFTKQYIEVQNKAIEKNLDKMK